MANVTKRAEALLEEAAQQSKQGTDSSSLQDLLALFDAEMKRQLKAFRATSGERMNLNGSGGGTNDSRAKPGAPADHHHTRGRTDFMMTVSEAMARDIRSGGPLARSIQQTYAIGRKPTLR